MGAPGCKKRFLTRGELVEHEKDCRWVKRACKALVMGCKHMALQHDLELHQSACPLIGLMPEWQAMQERCRRQQETLVAVQAHRTQLEHELQDLQSQYEGGVEHGRNCVDKLYKRIAKLERAKKRKRTTITRRDEGVTSIDIPIVINSDDGGDDEQDDEIGARQAQRSKRIKKNTTGRSNGGADTRTAQSGSTTRTALRQPSLRNGRSVSVF